MVKLCSIIISFHFIFNYLFLVPIWLKYDRKEVSWSSTKNGLADIPLIAAQWLKHFKHQNGSLLDELNVSIFLMDDFYVMYSN